MDRQRKGLTKRLDALRDPKGLLVAREGAVTLRQLWIDTPSGGCPIDGVRAETQETGSVSVVNTGRPRGNSKKAVKTLDNRQGFLTVTTPTFISTVVFKGPKAPLAVPFASKINNAALQADQTRVRNAELAAEVEEHLQVVDELPLTTKQFWELAPEEKIKRRRLQAVAGGLGLVALLVVWLAASAGSSSTRVDSGSQDKSLYVAPQSNDAVSTPSAGATMPDLDCGMNLAVAVDRVKGSGVTEVRTMDATQERRTVLIPQNWILIAALPEQGSAISDGTAVLSAVKAEEFDPAICNNSNL